MNVLVVDDEMLARKRLCRLLDEFEDISVVAEASHGAEAIELAQTLAPDLVFMDIQMPGVNGLSAAAAIAKLDPAPALVFCTAYDEHALAAFDVAAVDYLLKPVERVKLAAALQKCRRLSRVQLRQDDSGADFLLAHSARGSERIALSDIYLFRAEQKYVVALHRQGETLLSDSLNKLEQDWPGQFVRIHRNTLVAARYLRGVVRDESGYVALIEGLSLRPPVSRRHVQDVKHFLSQD